MDIKRGIDYKAIGIATVPHPESDDWPGIALATRTATLKVVKEGSARAAYKSMKELIEIDTVMREAVRRSTESAATWRR